MRDDLLVQEIVRVTDAQGSRGQYKGHCPAHNDPNPSLSIKEGNNGAPVLLHCHAGCTFEEIKAALISKGVMWPTNGSGQQYTNLNLPKGFLPTFNKKPYVAHWPYKGPEGQIIGYAVRYQQAGGPKDVIPYFKKDKDDHWKVGALPEPRPLYNLDRITQAAKNEIVWIFEGEKCCEAAKALDLLATTSQGGASSGHKADWSPLQGRKSVVIWPDNHTTGQNYAAIIKDRLEALDTPPADIKIVDTKALLLSDGEDIVDWIPQQEEPRLALDCLEFVTKTEDIIIKAGELPQIIDRAEAALLKNQPYAIFQRAGLLVKVAEIDQVDKQTTINRKPGAIIITQVRAAHLTELFCKTANFIHYNSLKDTYYPVDPPAKIANTYVERIGEWKAPVLTRLIECPTMRDDGSILDAHGYDQKTGLYFAPGNTRFLKVPLKPNKDDAIKALNKLKRPLKDFPFSGEGSKSVALAAILTALTRQAYKAAPLFAFSAPEARSGKSLLADIVAMIATGRPAPVMAQAKDSEEDKKRLFSVLLSGDPLVCIDNVERPLSGEGLCIVLTQGTFQERLLGTNEKRQVDARATFMATGNNLSFKGDMTVRALFCSIVPGVEAPEERKFNTNLYESIPKFRPLLVQAGLILLRAYHVAGRPKQNIKPWGGFDEWSDLVRSALIWLGEDDPCLTRKKVVSTDDNRVQIGCLLDAWHEHYRSESYTIKSVLKECKENYQSKKQYLEQLKKWREDPKLEKPENPEDKNITMLNDALLEINTGGRGGIDPTSLGKFLGSIEGRIINKLRMVKDPNSPKNRSKWFVQKLS